MKPINQHIVTIIFVFMAAFLCTTSLPIMEEAASNVLVNTQHLLTDIVEAFDQWIAQHMQL